MSEHVLVERWLFIAIQREGRGVKADFWAHVCLFQWTGNLNSRNPPVGRVVCPTTQNGH